MSRLESIEVLEIRAQCWRDAYDKQREKATKYLKLVLELEKTIEQRKGMIPISEGPSK